MTPTSRSALYDGTARCHLYRGDAATVQHDKAVAMSGTKGAIVLGQRDDGVLGESACVDGVEVFVGDVKVVAADESDTQHDLGHG